MENSVEPKELYHSSFPRLHICYRSKLILGENLILTTNTYTQQLEILVTALM